MDSNILTQIEEKYASFSKGQRRIADYILKNYDKAAFMTATKLGSSADISESTVVRFASELGYSGYPEMKRALQSVVRKRLTSVQRIEVSKDLLENSDILSAVLSADIEQINMTMQEAVREDFKKAVDAIVSAKHIYVFGLRSSSALAGFMGFYFNLLFDNVRVVNEYSMSDVFEQIMRVGDGDVFIGLCFPRYSKRTIRAMHYAKERGANVIGITDAQSSPIAKIADVTLCARSDMISFVDSLVAPMSIVNALIVASSAKAKGSDLENDFEKLEKMWSEFDVYENDDV